MKTKKLVIALAASVALHAAVPEAVVRIKDMAPRFKDLIERVDSEIDKMKIEKARKKLIAKARKDIKNGQFNLGKFILDAERIDAEEKGEKYKYEEALGKLEKKISELQDIVEKGYKVQRAVPKILPEFDYYGFSMGSTGDAIIENGGNCEAISHYIVSIVHGAGYKENVYFRVYSDHVAPVFVDNGVEYDLSGGNYAEIKGVKFAPEKLVDFYAVKHGLEESGESRFVAMGKKEGGSFSYPHTDEPYSRGSAPIFAQHGVKGFKPTDDKPKSEMSDYEYCLHYGGENMGLRYELLNPIPYRVNPLESSSVLVTPMEPRGQASLDCITMVIETETKALENSSNDAERIMHLAVLSGFYLDVHRQMLIMGKTMPAKKAFEHRKDIEEKAKKIFEGIEDNERFAEQLTKVCDNSALSEYHWGSELWNIIFLGEAGVEFLFDLMKPGAKYNERMYYSLDSALTALRIFPPTREGAEKKMKEWIHTHTLYSMGDCDWDGRYDDDTQCDYDGHGSMTDMPPGHAEPGELTWPLYCPGLDDLTYMDFTYDIAENYPPASRFISHAIEKETEAPEFRKLMKVIGKLSKSYGCKDDPEERMIGEHGAMVREAYCIDDRCKSTIILEFGVNALFMGEGFTASEHDAELKFAKEFKKWLDCVKTKDPEAERVAKFMKEHIKKKYGF